MEALRVLLLENSEDDAELILRELHQGGFDVASVRADSEISFRRQMAEFRPQVILSDFSLPGFDGDSALNLARQEMPGIPFVFVSGSMGEEVAIEALKRGATDYVLKERLSRLVPAIRRALDEVNEQCKRADVEARLRQRLVYEEATAQCMRLLAASEWNDRMIDALLSILRITTGVSRSYLYRHHQERNDSPTEAWAEITHESNALGVDPTINDPAMKRLNYADAAPTLLPTLMARSPYAAFTTDLVVPEREILESQGVKSILILPVFTGEKLWGFIGFDDCREPRAWQDSDRKLLAVVNFGVRCRIARARSWNFWTQHWSESGRCERGQTTSNCRRVLGSIVIRGVVAKYFPFKLASSVMLRCISCLVLPMH